MMSSPRWPELRSVRAAPLRNVTIRYSTQQVCGGWATSIRRAPLPIAAPSADTVHARRPVIRTRMTRDTQLTNEQLDEAAVVDEDLAYLMDEWQPRLEPPKLRRLSPVLRRLLVDGQYGRAWRNLGLPGEPYVTATDLDAMLGTLDRSIIQLAFAPPGSTVSRVLAAGGDLQLRVPAYIPAGAVIVVIPGHEQGLGPVLAAVAPDKLNMALRDPHAAVQASIVQQLGHRVARGLGLTAYLRSPAALVLRDEISRQDVIAYVANKLGGAHFDPKRQGKTGERYAILDKKLATLAPANAPEATIVYAELLSMAEAVAESSDSARFRQAYASVRRLNDL